MMRLRGFFFLRKSASDVPSTDWIAFDEIERLLRKRKIDKSWLVRRGDDHEWVTISDLLLDFAHDPSVLQSPAAAFACVKCRLELRLPLRVDGTIYRCPRCGTNYKSVQAHAASPVFLVIPMAIGTAAGESGTLQRSGDELPSIVKGALTLFNLDDTATFDAVRQAHREMIKLYHPDKVAHLGPDLQRLAEVKTKLINSSFTILEKFFSARGHNRA
jgi:DnaJ-domain-containing protein 1